MRRPDEFRESIELLSRSASPVSQELARYIRVSPAVSPTPETEALPMTLSIQDPHANRVGYFLVELDRELRRTVELLTRDQAREQLSEGRWPRPGGPSSLVVNSATAGSLDLLVAVYDAARNLLLSDPVQLAATLMWLYQLKPKTWGTQRSPTQRTASEIVKGLEKSAREAIKAGQPCELHVELDADGAMNATFRTRSDV